MVENNIGFDNGLHFEDSRISTSQEFTRDLKAYSLNPFKPMQEHAGGGPVLYREKNTVYVDDSDLHSLIVGDTGSMKTLRYVLPLMRTCIGASESMVVIDPKGELIKKMSPILKDAQYNTVILNFRDPHLSPSRWNPFDPAIKAYKSKRADHLERATILLNDLYDKLFFTRSSSDKDEYWNESAGQFGLGISLMSLAKNRPDELTIESLLRWRYDGIRSGSLMREFKYLPQDCDAYRNLAGTLLLDATNTKSCILSTFDQLVRPFKSSPALAKMLSEQTFSFDDIGCKKTAVFLVVPDEKTTFHFLAALFINQCYESLLNTAEQYNGVVPVKTNFILEEFCNIPTITDILPMLTAARSRNIRLHLVIQSYGQLIDKYGENVSKAILDNCGNLIYLHSREMSFLSYMSSLVGDNAYDHPLISAAKLQRLKRNETLILHNRCYPFVAKDVPLIFDYPGSLGDSPDAAVSMPQQIDPEQTDKLNHLSASELEQILGEIIPLMNIETLKQLDESILNKISQINSLPTLQSEEEGIAELPFNNMSNMNQNDLAKDLEARLDKLFASADED